MSVGESDRTSDELHGYLRVNMQRREGSAFYQLRRNEREALATALREHRAGTRADPWYDGEDNDGDLLMIDLSLVEAIVDVSPAAIAQARRDAEIEKARERWSGE